MAFNSATPPFVACCLNPENRGDCRYAIPCPDDTQSESPNFELIDLMVKGSSSRARLYWRGLFDKMKP